MATKLLTDFCSAGRQEVEGTTETFGEMNAEAEVPVGGITQDTKVAETKIPAENLANVTQDGRQDVEGTAETFGEMNAEAEVPVGDITQDTKVAETEIPAKVPADVTQDGRQDVKGNVSAENPSESTATEELPGSQDAEVESGGGQAAQVMTPESPIPATEPDFVDRMLSKRKEKLTYSNVTVRLTPEVKRNAQALAGDLGMSLSEMCAMVIDGFVRQAAERKARVA